jgi:hypothetical protein
MIHAIPSDPNTIVYTRVWGCSVSHRRRGKRRGEYTWWVLVAGEDMANGVGSRRAVAATKGSREREREGSTGERRGERGVRYGKLAPLTASASRCGNFNAASFVLQQKKKAVEA